MAERIQQDHDDDGKKQYDYRRWRGKVQPRCRFPHLKFALRCLPCVGGVQSIERGAMRIVWDKPVQMGNASYQLANSPSRHAVWSGSSERSLGILRICFAEHGYAYYSLLC
jgi:hypothetical protein